MGLSILIVENLPSFLYKNDRKKGVFLIKKKGCSLFIENKVGSIFDFGHFWIFKNVQNGFLEEVLKWHFFEKVGCVHNGKKLRKM